MYQKFVKNLSKIYYKSIKNYKITTFEIAIPKVDRMYWPRLRRKMYNTIVQR